MLRGRVLVAHNAPFDYGFLAQEFQRANVRLPVERRLCTLALNRRLSPATGDLKLGTLAAHYGIKPSKAHDALEDARTLRGVLRGSLQEASRSVSRCRSWRARRSRTSGQGFPRPGAPTGVRAGSATGSSRG